MSELPKPITMTRNKVVVSRATWETLLDALDDSGDRAALRGADTRRKAGIDDGMEVSFFRRILAGESPVRVWREYRQLSLQQLAKLARVSSAYLSEIETGKKPGSAATLQRIAHALGVDTDELIRARPRTKRRSKR